MNILFLVARFPLEENDTTLEKDLIKIFSDNGHNCYVAYPHKKKETNDPLFFKLNSNISLLKVNGIDLFSYNKYKKAISIILLPYLFIKYINKYLSNTDFDLIISYTPYMSNPLIIKYLKNKFKCKLLLMMWDIFPQNAIDLGYLKNKLLINYFKQKEKLMLSLFDKVAVNSLGNYNYVLKNYNFIKKENIFIVNNCEYPSARNEKNTFSREKFGLPSSMKVFLFGGNIGVPQQLENIVNLASLMHGSYFVLVGNGTEFKRINNLSQNSKNIKIINRLNRADYEELLDVCDVGMISLNTKFTVPNFPIKVTGYIKKEKPILALLDSISFNDLGYFINTNNIGLAIDMNTFINVNFVIEHFSNSNIEIMKKNAKNIFLNNFHIQNAYNIITKEFTIIK